MEFRNLRRKVKSLETNHNPPPLLNQAQVSRIRRILDADRDQKSEEEARLDLAVKTIWEKAVPDNFIPLTVILFEELPETKMMEFFVLGTPYKPPHYVAGVKGVIIASTASGDGWINIQTGKSLNQRNSITL